jgi:hypothetical protein
MCPILLADVYKLGSGNASGLAGTDASQQDQMQGKPYGPRNWLQQDGRPEQLDFVIRKNPTPDDLNAAAAQSGARITLHQIGIHRKAEDR